MAIGSNSATGDRSKLSQAGSRASARNYLGGWQSVLAWLVAIALLGGSPYLHYNPDQSNGPNYQSAALRRHYPLDEADVLMQLINYEILMACVRMELSRIVELSSIRVELIFTKIMPDFFIRVALEPCQRNANQANYSRNPSLYGQRCP